MVQPRRTFHPRDGGMTALAFSDDPRDVAKCLEAHVGGRNVLARKLGCAPGTLENLQRDRLKAVKRSWLEAKLEAFLARRIEAEIRRLSHELETYRRTHGDVAGAPEMARLVAAVEQAQRLIAAKGEGNV
jgi:hypothetical protein